MLSSSTTHALLSVFPEGGGISHAAAPPLRSFTYVGPLGILGRIPQCSHNRTEDASMLFSEFKVWHEVIASLACIAVRSMHIAADDDGDASRGSQGMSLGDKAFLSVVARQEKALAMHPVHGPPCGGLVLGCHHTHGACCAELRCEC